MTNKPTILIVGASRGLGLALVEQFCSRDWHVIGTVRGKSAALDDLKARFPASGILQGAYAMAGRRRADNIPDSTPAKYARVFRYAVPRG
jgi:NAD(P)-dependent dehydrogenase (short-subunit alcohol dehydrogenase family)